MDNEKDNSVKMVPAICTQCGGQVSVDPSMEAAVCQFCGTPFIVEKAINQYNVKHATIEHADNVTIDMGSSVKSVLDFAGEQIRERREVKREERREQREMDAKFIATFFKFFGIFCVVTMVIWFIGTALGLFG